MLSLQNHEHRSEHWLIAEGEVEVTLDKKTINLVENENIFIPKGAFHRIANKGSKDLIIIRLDYIIIFIISFNIILIENFTVPHFYDYQIFRTFISNSMKGTFWDKNIFIFYKIYSFFI